MPWAQGSEGHHKVVKMFVFSLSCLASVSFLMFRQVLLSGLLTESLLELTEQTKVGRNNIFMEFMSCM